MRKLIQKLKDPLYKNSIFLMLSSVTGAGTGFVFWVIAARLYSSEDVKKIEIKTQIIEEAERLWTKLTGSYRE